MSNNQEIVENAVTLDYIRDLAKIDDKIQKVKKDRNKLRKRAKADGIVLKDVDDALAFSELNNTELQRYFSTLHGNLTLLKVPIGTQLSLLDEAVDDPTADNDGTETTERILNEALGAGYRASLRGEGQEKSPHEANSPSGQAWLDGWSEGQEHNAKGLKKGGKK